MKLLLPPRFRRYFVTGVVLLLPLWVTWLIFQFLLGVLSRLGRPLVQVLSMGLRKPWPQAADLLLHPWFEFVLAIVIIIAGLYFLGWLATHVMVRQIIAGIEGLLDRIPIIKAIYGSTKKLVAVFKHNPEKLQRVVLIDFPSPEMKTIGFLTRVIHDSNSGRELGVVYVPTSPNPTSGYMEIVPMDKVTPTDWTLDQAMSFILTGGTSAPDTITFTRAADATDVQPS